MPVSVEAYASFVAGWVKDRGYSGVYLDELFSVTAERKANLPYGVYPWPEIMSRTAFDCDGDGKADSFEKLNAQFERNRPLWTASLRKKLGDSAVLIANAVAPPDRPIADPALNGITVSRLFPNSGSWFHSMFALNG